MSSCPTPIRVVDKDDAALHLWVSNQSFVDDPVMLVADIDGVEVVNQPFDVRSQHNWMLFPIACPPGEHVLRVVSNTGTALEQPFTLPEQGRRYAVIDYWNYPEAEGRKFTWLMKSTPVYFM